MFNINIDFRMQINSGETKTLSGVINDNITMGPGSTLILNNVVLNGNINGDGTTTVICRGNCTLNGNVNCGNLNIGG